MKVPLNFHTYAIRVTRRPRWLISASFHIEKTGYFSKQEYLANVAGSIFVSNHTLSALAQRISTVRTSAIGRYVAAVGLLWQMWLVNSATRRFSKIWTTERCADQQSINFDYAKPSPPLGLRLAQWLESPQSRGLLRTGFLSDVLWIHGQIAPIKGKRVIAIWNETHQCRCGLYGTQLNWLSAPELAELKAEFQSVSATPNFPTCWAYWGESIEFYQATKPTLDREVLAVTGDGTWLMGELNYCIAVFKGTTGFAWNRRKLWQTLDNQPVDVRRFFELPYWYQRTLPPKEVSDASL